MDYPALCHKLCASLASVIDHQSMYMRSSMMAIVLTGCDCLYLRSSNSSSSSWLCVGRQVSRNVDCSSGTLLSHALNDTLPRMMSLLECALNEHRHAAPVLDLRSLLLTGLQIDHDCGVCV